jgi:tRNA A-37 threonylcarbamoyl transferase component Bud32
MPQSIARIDSFDLAPGRILAGKYMVDVKLGAGWEGEVYKVEETRTGIHRAAKLFYPQRNVRDRAVTFYAKKLERLRACPIVIQYVHTETVKRRGIPVTCLISEYVDGEILRDFIARQRGRRLPPFEALHLVHALARGLEEIHRVKEYHGDLHDGNVLVRRRGVFFDVKILDFYHWGAATASHIRDDVADLIRILYDAVGGRERYASQPAEIKSICRGLRRDLIARAFPTAHHLRTYLETFMWDD